MATIKEENLKKTGLRLVIRKKEGEEPFLDLIESIKEYKFMMNSADDTKSKDKNIMVELHITGTYRAEVADQASKFMVDWALEETAEAYKYVELSKFDDKQVHKRYIFPKAFVVDYTEEDSEGSENPEFKLFIKENMDDRRKFKIFVDEELPSELIGGDNE